MGLDMFLYSYEDTEKKDDKKRVHWIEWRKANAIHWWFVSQIQGGVDEGDEYPVPREKLVELLELCVAAHGSDWVESSKLMPTMPGPFFGSTAYDDHYYWELGNTISKLEWLLSSPKSERVHFYYHAWW